MKTGNKFSTSGWNFGNLGRLFEFCTGGSDSEFSDISDHKRAELLLEWLDTPFINKQFLNNQLPKEFTHLTNVPGIVFRETIGDLLANPQSDPRLILSIKNYTKKESQHHKSDIEYEIINILYYAAIAHALLYQGRKISKFDFSELHKSFSYFVGVTWIPENLKALFTSACKLSEKEFNNPIP